MIKYQEPAVLPCPHCGSNQAYTLWKIEKGDLLSSILLKHQYPTKSINSASIICGICREYFEMCWIVSATMEELLTTVNYTWQDDHILVLYKRVLAKGGLLP